MLPNERSVIPGTWLLLLTPSELSSPWAVSTILSDVGTLKATVEAVSMLLRADLKAEYNSSVTLHNREIGPGSISTAEIG